MADKMLKIELKKSLIGRGAKQIATAEALGLKKPGDVTVQPDNAATQGKINVSSTGCSNGSRAVNGEKLHFSI